MTRSGPSSHVCASPSRSTRSREKQLHRDRGRATRVGINADTPRLLSGKEEAGEYGFREGSQNHHVFCSHCGVRVYTYGHIEQIGGDYVSIALSTLDDLSPAELAAAPVRYMNGRNDDWFHVPAETQHL